MTRLSLRLRVAPGAERGCFGIAIVMVRDRSLAFAAPRD
jgi:hypothetical protein